MSHFYLCCCDEDSCQTGCTMHKMHSYSTSFSKTGQISHTSVWQNDVTSHQIMAGNDVEEPLWENEENIGITDQTLMCRSCAPISLVDFQHSSGILLNPNVRETLPWTLKSIAFLLQSGGWGGLKEGWVYTQAALQASTSQVCLQLLVLAGSWEMRTRGRDGREGRMPYSCHWQNTLPVGV